MHRWITRACLTAGTITTLGLLSVGTAFAHVTVNSPDAAQGEYTVVTFRVPNEAPTASTTGLTVTLPARSAGETTLSSVRTTPVPGWTATVAKDPATSAPTSVTWTAAPGTSIGENQFGQFELSLGKLPTTETLSLPAAQTYSDGSVVKWDEPAKTDGSEPEHPTPTLKLAAAGDSVASAEGSVASPQTASSVTSTDNTARWLGGAGLLLGALGLAVGGGLAIRGRRHS